MDRKKSHTDALDDIATRARDDSPLGVFAGFAYSDRTDFTHSLESDGDTELALDLLSAHIAALSEASGLEPVKVASLGVERAEENLKTGRGEWGGK